MRKSIGDIYFFFTCVCVLACAGARSDTCGSHRTACWSQLSLSCRSQGSNSGFYSLSHLTSPLVNSWSPYPKSFIHPPLFSVLYDGLTEYFLSASLSFLIKFEDCFLSLYNCVKTREVSQLVKYLLSKHNLVNFPVSHKLGIR